MRVNWELYGKVRERILAEHKSFDMRYVNNKLSCGTVCCLLGWTYKVAGLDAYYLSFEEGANLLGVDGYVYELFLDMTQSSAEPHTLQYAEDYVQYFDRKLAEIDALQSQEVSG